MNKFKKFVAAALASATMFATGITAFAEETITSYTDESTVTINKTYNLEGEGTSPKETFSFKVEKESVSDSATTNKNDIPTIDNFSISYDEGAAGGDKKVGTASINLPSTEDFKSVGVYTYKITEVIPTSPTAGVTYDESPVYLKVTVVDDNGTLKRIVALHKASVSGTKIGDEDGQNASAFTNTYTANKLTVSKTVEGLLGDKTKDFTFTVKIDDATDKTNPTSYTAKKGETEIQVNANKETTITLKHGENFYIENLPAGVKYTVTETNVNGYTTKVAVGTAEATENNVVTGTMNKDAVTAAYTNTKGGTPDTGINLTTLPYILVFAGVIAAGAYVVISRKNRFED